MFLVQNYYELNKRYFKFYIFIDGILLGYTRIINNAMYKFYVIFIEIISVTSV